tara:strand:+ start:2090 stop:2599 length:510 start_codon:yes stop_codon:yes gene_type:complete
MEETNIEAVDSVTTHEEEVVTEDKDALIAELQGKLKNKSIEARKAKKETKPEVDNSLLERLNRMELKENGLKDAEEIELVLGKAKELSISPLVLVKDGLADGILERHRKVKADELASVGTSSRGATNQKDGVDYWISKGELPPADKVELRRKVVNAKIAKQSHSKMFNY